MNIVKVTSSLYINQGEFKSLSLGKIKEPLKVLKSEKELYDMK